MQLCMECLQVCVECAGMWGVSVCGGLCECVCGSVCALGVCRCVCGRVQVCGVCMWVCMSMCGVSVCVGRCVRWVCAGGGVAGVWGVYVVVCEHVWGEVWGGGECVWGWCVRWVCVGAGMRVGGYAGVSG